MSEKATYFEDTDLFESGFKTDNEDKAVRDRGLFISKFPVQNISSITLDEYVIGKGTETFCSLVEAKTRSWANIQGATSAKFGIYYGRTKGDPTRKYRFTKKFGDSPSAAFSRVKESLSELVQAGKEKNFEKIDKNQLSQMFKAKILSLYFPEIYVNICSKEHLENIGNDMGIQRQDYVSAYQSLILNKKLENEATEYWSNPKYMTYLYAIFNDDILDRLSDAKIVKPRKKTHAKINFEDISSDRDKIGKLSEEYAIDWERTRLIGMGYEELSKKIVDRRDRPSYGYDYLSFSTPKVRRYIEVKSVGKDRSAGSFRFYLSRNEKQKSKSNELKNNYYFYLVFYNSDGKPCDVVTHLAKDMYDQSDIESCAYIVKFDVKK